MAIQNLACVRQSGVLVVRWNWSGDISRAMIRVVRILDGAVLLERAVTGILYQNAINGVAHGFELKVPEEPVRVLVSDEENEAAAELNEPKYLVRWRLESRELYERSLFRSKSVGKEYRLRMEFPCDSEVPGDLFFYVPADSDPADVPWGYLPEIKSGMNLYGLAGRPVTLYCNPKHESYCSLFRLERMPDYEAKE